MRTRPAGGPVPEGRATMSEDRRNLALAIRSCLDELERQAAAGGLADLAHFIGLAGLAADDAAMAADPHASLLKALSSGTAGHC
jgi:hypothetical protein